MLSKEEVIARCKKNTLWAIDGIGSAQSLRSEVVQNVTISEEILSDMDCTNTLFIGVHFIGCVFNFVLFYNAAFRDCYFEGCSIIDCNFVGSAVTDTAFNMCFIRKGNFHRMSISGGKFTGCEFMDAPMWEADLHHVSMNECNFCR